MNVVSYEQGPQNDITSPFDAFPDGIKMQTNMPDTNVGEVFDWNSGSVTTFEDTVYAFGATVLSSKLYFFFIFKGTNSAVFSLPLFLIEVNFN